MGWVNPEFDYFIKVYIMRVKRNCQIRLLSLLVFVIAALFSLEKAYAQMSDEAVVSYVKSSVKSGMSQQQIASELLSKGVTKEQLKRIRDQYKDTNLQSKEDVQQVKDVRRTVAEDSKLYEEAIEDDESIEDDEQLGDGDEAFPYKENEIFGRKIFKGANVTFEPSLNMATPADYRLGPGDEVVIDVYGASESHIAQKISPEGYINISSVGPVNLNGLTLKAAKERIFAKLSKIYSGMQSSNLDVSTDVKVTIGEIRTIQVNILGEISKPGTYALSSFSTVFHALYKANGVNKIGSLRNIQVIRGDKVAANVDVYEYLMKGKSSDDIRLQEGDLIIVRPFKTIVKITGKVKRPMCYELKEGETLADLINYAGGFNGDAYYGELTIDRSIGVEKRVFTVPQEQFATFAMMDADKVDVGSSVQLYANKIEIKGALYRPGVFELTDETSTVKGLIEMAGGLMDDAFLNRAVLHRRYPDKRMKVIPIDIKGLLAGTAQNIKLQKNDILYIPSIYDLKEEETITVSGEVYAPGDYPYAENTTLEDIIIQAGGLKISASTVRVDVNRALNDPTAKSKKREISETFSFGIKDGFVVDGEPGFILKPYDQVIVRPSPGYTPPMNVTVLGEVQFAGTFALSLRNERLSDIISKAGGITEFAYLKAATLTRKATKTELEMQQKINDMIEHTNLISKDTILVKQDTIKDYYTIAIDLEKALSNPHSDADLVLREGDLINVPQYINVVRISGNVNSPNVVTYNPNGDLSYYLSCAGGLAERSKRSNIYVIYPNGMIKKVGGSAAASEIEPGSEIVVPRKAEGKWTTATTLTALSTFSYIILVVATLINNLK